MDQAARSSGCGVGGERSLMWRARRMAKVRSVMSWASPLVQSLSRSSTMRSRTLRMEVSSDFSSGLASGWVEGTRPMAPRETVWGGKAQQKDDLDFRGGCSAVTIFFRFSDTTFEGANAT